MFATLFFGILDPSTGSLTYVNGGHEPPVVLSASGAGALQRLAPTGPALGLLPDRTFEVGRTVLAPGDLFLAFTDGVSEARNPSGGVLGEEPVLNLVREAKGSAADLLAEIDRTVAAHAAGSESFDDITMLAVLRSPS
jgi:serine phosphatase RsbU (regulator of sigma subunit)